MKKLLLLLIYGFILLVYGCTKPDNQTKASKVPISTSFDLTKIVDDKLFVQINPGVFSQDSIIYRIPKTIQGTYKVKNYGNFIVDFKALDYEGNELTFNRLDINSWAIKNAKNLDRITYNVNDTFDAEGGEFKVPTHMSGINFEKDNFVLNLHAIIGYFDSLKDNEYLLDITYPLIFKSSSALKLIAEEVYEDSTATRRYFAKRYFDITDNPMFYGDLDIEEFMVHDMVVGITVYSPSKSHTAAQILEYAKKTMQKQKNFLGSLNTIPRYDVFLYLSRENETSPTSGMGALEHFTSTVVVLGDAITSEELEKEITRIISHEFFHTVTPLNVHSEDVHYFDYNTPTFSKHLWMYEGLTVYFTELFQINQGLIKKEEYYKKLSDRLQNTLSYDDAISLTKTSENILDFPYSKSFGNFYSKGAIVNMCIDILIREGSNGDRGILSIMEELSIKYGKDRPFEDDAFIDEIISMTYPSVGDFFNNHVIGSTPINYNDFFDKVGLSLIDSKVETKSPWVFTWKDEVLNFNGGIGNNSFWNEQGILPYDILKAVNGVEITKKNIQDIYWHTIVNWKPGDDFEIVLIREGEETTLKSTMTQSYTSEFSIEENENATDTQKALLKYWLKG